MGGVVLFLCDSFAAHALTSIADSGDDILRHSISSTDDTDANCDGRAVLAQPAPCRREHVLILRRRPYPECLG